MKSVAQLKLKILCFCSWCRRCSQWSRLWRIPVRQWWPVVLWKWLLLHFCLEGSWNYKMMVLRRHLAGIFCSCDSETNMGFIRLQREKNAEAHVHPCSWNCSCSYGEVLKPWKKKQLKYVEQQLASDSAHSNSAWFHCAVIFLSKHGFKLNVPLGMLKLSGVNMPAKWYITKR